jgi:hypothetical protein
MNTGTAVFFIVLLLVASFAGLGYLINQRMSDLDTISELQQENQTQAGENTRLQEQVRALEQQNAILTAERDRAVQAYTDLDRTCRQPAAQPAPTGLQNLLGALPWILVTAGGVTRITSLRFRRNRKPGRVSLELDRSQMAEFIRWQRSRKE